MRDERLPFDLSTLQVFIAVCDAGTMAAAAATLQLTQPAVSQVIQEMESRLGARLFDRNIRPIALTPAGILLQQHAVVLLSDARRILPLLRGVQRGRLAVFRIGLVESLTRTLSVRITRAVADTAERVVVLAGLTAQHSTALLNRSLDLLVGIDDMTENVGLERRPVGDEPYVMVAAAGSGPLDLATLARDRPMIRFSARSRTGAELDQYLRRLGIEPARGLEFDSCYGVSAAVLDGGGWAITTPLCLIEAGLPAGAYSIAPLPPTAPRRSFTVLGRCNEMGPLPRQVTRVAADALQEGVGTFFAAAHSWIVDAVQFAGRPAGFPRKSAAAQARLQTPL